MRTFTIVNPSTSPGSEADVALEWCRNLIGLFGSNVCVCVACVQLHLNEVSQVVYSFLLNQIINTVPAVFASCLLCQLNLIFGSFLFLN